MLTAPANHIPANNPILTYQTFLGALPTAAFQGYITIRLAFSTLCALRSQPNVHELQLINHIDHL